MSFGLKNQDPRSLEGNGITAIYALIMLMTSAFLHIGAISYGIV